MNMTTTKSKRSEICEALAHCTGSEFWYRHPLVRTFIYTDGVQMFAEMAGAYWFLDIVATEVFPFQRKEEFIVVMLAVTGSTARINAEDGNGREFWHRDIAFTDCPEGDWKFFLVNNTFLVPSEY
jgi:hypothetical protein